MNLLKGERIEEPGGGCKVAVLVLVGDCDEHVDVDVGTFVGQLHEANYSILDTTTTTNMKVVLLKTRTVYSLEERRK